jgi:micrococcal nuclease
MARSLAIAAMVAALLGGVLAAWLWSRAGQSATLPAAAPAPRSLGDLPPALINDVKVPVERLQGLPRARVVRAVDGDTVIVQTDGREHRLRLIGVDTPESVDPRRPVQPYGKAAAAFTSNVLTGRTVYLELDVEERDQYGRLLAYLYLEDGTFFNALLLRAGFAHVLTIPPNVKYADLFQEMARRARAESRGLWALPAR